MAETRGATEQTQRSRGQSGMERSNPQGAGMQRRDPFELGGPFALMRRMQDEFDRIFGLSPARGIRGLMGSSEIADWSPAVEVFQRGDELVIRADVPGLSRDDLSVEIGDDAVTISGERKMNREEEREGIYRSERSYGSFCRVIPLPEGAMGDNAKANFKDGVLEVVVPTPPQEVRRGRRIEIGQNASQGSQQAGAQGEGQKRS
jgi:HSP20 family protein